MPEEVLNLSIEFGGGADYLFGKIKSRKVALDKNKIGNIRDLIFWMRDNILTEREDMFLQNESVRPGILVLINDTDWELLGELDYSLQEKDEVMFISTLHGG